jgi:hypothetical protein
MRGGIASADARPFLKATRAAVSIAALALVLGSPAAAEEVTRVTYKEVAEPICQANTEANERILAGVRGEVKRGKLGPASKRFARAATALRRTLGELRKLPRPPADRARLSRWLGFVADEVELLERTSRYLAAGQKGAAEGMVVRLKSVATRANNVVFAFEFEYCRFDPARFT